MSIIVQLNPDVPPTGSDLGVVNAARKSFGRRSELECVDHVKGVYKLKDKDKRLLEFLARGMTADDFDEFVSHVGTYGYNVEKLPDPEWKTEQELLVEKLWEWRNTPTHDTPFNHGFFSFEVKAPIFVRAQLVKHEYLVMSEYSRRYITDDVEFYKPDYWRKAAEDKKQGSLDEAVYFLRMQGFGEQAINDGVFKHGFHSLDLYRDMITAGVAPEQARMVLPQSLMTSWTWSGTLGAFANMCKLRLHPEAQYESRIVAKEVYKHLQNQFPVSAKLLVEGVL